MLPSKAVLYGITSGGVAVPVQVSALGILQTSGGGGGGATVPTVFKTGSAFNVGATAIWTPAAGKKFNLMGGQISVSGTLAATDTLGIALLDGAITQILTFAATLVMTTPSGDTQIGFDFGGGFIVSAAANNVLNVNLTAAITNANGFCGVNVWGFES